MLRSKKPITLIAILLLFVTIMILPVWAEQESASSAISSAKNTILTCYSAARQAEAAGANITVLTETLNQACSLLSQAEFAYATKNFDAAYNLASQSQNVLENFIGEANILEVTNLQQRNRDFLVNVVGSIIGAFAVIAFGVAAWLFLRKKYEKNKVITIETSRV